MEKIGYHGPMRDYLKELKSEAAGVRIGSDVTMTTVTGVSLLGSPDLYETREKGLRLRFGTERENVWNALRLWFASAVLFGLCWFGFAVISGAVIFPFPHRDALMLFCVRSPFLVGPMGAIFAVVVSNRRRRKEIRRLRGLSDTDFLREWTEFVEQKRAENARQQREFELDDQARRTAAYIRRDMRREYS
jgi:hypothetical protein